MDWRLSNKQIVLYAIIVTNILLVGLIWAKQTIEIPPAADPAIVDPHETTSIEYEYELMDVTETDGWRIEHYQQYELTVNAAGEIVSKKPTEQTQHMKYWLGD